LLSLLLLLLFMFLSFPAGRRRLHNS